jgi:UDP-glucuronate decarboxylase
MKALVTGGAGFIGLHLSRRLVEEGYEVTLVDDLSRGGRDDAVASLSSSGPVRLVRRDLSDPEALADVGRDYDLIFHLAAIVGVHHVLERPYAVLRENVAMLLPALACAQQQRSLGRFVFASTSEVYAGSLELGTLPIPTPESAPIALPDVGLPRTSYMLSKLYGEALSQQAGVPFTIVRPHNVYGPRMGLAHVIPELLQRAHDAPEGGDLEVFSTDHTRTFCYVSDAVEMIWRAAVAEEGEGRTLNVGNQSPEVSIGELAALVADVVGKELRIVPRPATPGSPARRCPDMTETRRLTAYTPEIDLRTGVQLTYVWYAPNVFAPSAADLVRR